MVIKECIRGLFTAAIDLGTTTIVGYLLDGRTGENIGSGK